ncbi:hypothetical protein AGDE_00834, partial [Angomonas deanei]
MEALRIQGNALVGSDPAKAIEFYNEAMQLYDAKTDGEGEQTGCTLEEYTKCAGNAMTCMMKLNRRADCIEMAQRALRVNPIFGKANAMWGRCLVEDATLLEKDGPSIPDAFRLLCRAMYQVPALGESLHTTLVTALDAMLAEHKTNEVVWREPTWKRRCGYEHSKGTVKASTRTNRCPPSLRSVA